MGHVSRSIGLIDQMINQGNTIFIACDLEQKKIYTEYYNDIEFINHEGYPFKFSGNSNFSWDLMKRFTQLQSRMIEERKEVRKMVDAHQIDIILSDHRYGFRSEKVNSIFITHQLNLPVKWYENSIQGIHRRLMNKFDTIWVMDFEDSRLAGKLSSSSRLDILEYIGPYSRFMRYELEEKKNDSTVVIASGPAVYARKLIDNLDIEDISEVFLIASDKVVSPTMIKRLSNSWLEQDKAILSAGKIISRSGYSTIMDLHFLKCDAELIPTEGQGEQEYLSALHKKRPAII